MGRELQASKGEHPGPGWQQFGQKTDSDSGRVLRVMLIGLALGCALGKGEKKESRMNPRFLTKPTRRMKMPFTEMKKLKEAGVGGEGEVLAELQFCTHQVEKSRKHSCGTQQATGKSRGQ